MGVSASTLRVCRRCYLKVLWRLKRLFHPKKGMFDLRVWPGVEGSEKTPGKAPDRGKEQMQRLAKLAKKHRNGHMPKVDWLDRLTFREIEMINEKEKRSSDYMYLMIEYPTVQIDGTNHAVVYYEQDGDEMYQFKAQAEIVTVPDYETLQENLVESKQHRLARSLRSPARGRDAKPSAGERDQLAAVVAAPPARAPPAPDQDLVWKYRFYLSSNKRALTKFLECVNWNRAGEVRQALCMMKQWAPMDVEDALELLTPKFTHPAVRKYAISRLKQAPDEDLLLYLLQLVQALKYEDFNEIHDEYARTCGKEVAMYSDSEGKLVQSGHRGSQASLLSASVIAPSEMTSSTNSRRSVDDAAAPDDEPHPPPENNNESSLQLATRRPTLRLPKRDLHSGTRLPNGYRFFGKCDQPTAILVCLSLELCGLPWFSFGLLRIHYESCPSEKLQA